ncbi:MAG TPA: class I SAM-dependent methyltransferase [Paenalcaligenes sp.]|nr:class I SAM-dependent methyltransferase [Paenalcaligenes sp.]
MSHDDPRTFWDERFNQTEYYYGKLPNDFLKAQAKVFPRGGQLLSLGEGEGRNAVFMAQQGYEVTALDSAPAGLDKTQQLAKEKQVTVTPLLAHLKYYEFEPQAWDGVINIFCHVPAAVRRKIHQNLAFTLKQGGIFLMEAYTPEQLEYGTGGPKNIDLLYDPDTIRQELQGLELLHFEKVERNIVEGIGHDGPSSVLQVIARKN